MIMHKYTHLLLHAESKKWPVCSQGDGEVVAGVAFPGRVRGSNDVRTRRPPHSHLSRQAGLEGKAGNVKIAKSPFH